MRGRRSATLLLWLIAVLVVAAGPPAYGSLGAAPPGGPPPPPPGADMTVDGILGGNTRVAIIRTEGQTVVAGVGEHVGDSVVVSIQPKKVVLKEGSVTFEVPGPSRGPLVLGVTPPGVTPPPPPGAGMTVTGILGGRARVAIIRAEGQTVVAGVGEHVGDAVVVSIQPKKVVLKEGSATFEVPGPSTGVGVPLVLAVTPPGVPPPPPPGAGMTVTGILRGRARLAIIRAEGQTVIAGVGEHVGDAVVVSILSDKVVLKRRGVTFELPMGDTH
jgi:hypothetical protein